jgi:predicted RNase H-like nuclease (RuvC/YqgF family)
MDGDNLVEAEKEFEIAALKNEVEKLRKEITKYQILLNEVDDEANPNIISDEEVICVEQIAKLRQESAKRHLSTDEVKKLDILHKNLKMARGEGSRVNNRSLAKKLSAEELTAVAKGK